MKNKKVKDEKIKFCPSCHTKYPYKDHKCPKCGLRVLDLRWLDLSDRDPILLKVTSKIDNNKFEINQFGIIDVEINSTAEEYYANMINYTSQPEVTTSITLRALPYKNGHYMIIKPIKREI